ncbi:hypothetical protein [Burkholderia sp. Ax-1719]|uniref:hypothetical protein n=1 Tax=Burkholderia sp. Ax-1719 TaxID=2608334 RepID=UPI001423C2BF|nr:hypothetical protein [Burkholderia sp. Ax-1719]NIE64236.1 hypothetical protein [Burkholderia sp. Ax-1719]
MSQLLTVALFFIVSYLWDDSRHAAGLAKYLWIVRAIAALCIVLGVLEGIARLTRRGKDEPTAPVDAAPDVTPEPSADTLIPVGPELAHAVADRLDAGDELVFHHPYYCGMGFTRYGDAYVYASVQDGEIITPKWGDEAFKYEVRDGGKLFESRVQFIEWLTVQTDYSLHGDGNQRITLARLRSFVSGDQ